MMLSNQQISATPLAKRGEEVIVLLDEDAVKRLASVMTTQIILSNNSVETLVEPRQLEDSLHYAICCSMRACAGERVNEVIPVFLDELILGLTLRYRTSKVKVRMDSTKIVTNNAIEESSSISKPGEYSMVLDILSSLGIRVGRTRLIDPETTSNVLLLGLDEIRTLIGVGSDAPIETMVVRSLLSVQEADQAKLERVIGAYDSLYISADELLRQWGSSVVAAQLRPTASKATSVK